MNLPATIRLGTRPDGKPLEFAVEAPKSYAVRYDLATASRNLPRAAAAACALCSPRLARELRVTYAGDALAFGGQVIDAFMRQVEEHGVKASPQDLVNAGLPLYSELVGSLASAAEVDAVEGFTGPTSEGGT